VIGDLDLVRACVAIDVEATRIRCRILKEVGIAGTAVQALDPEDPLSTLFLCPSDNPQWIVNRLLGLTPGSAGAIPGALERMADAGVRPRAFVAPKLAGQDVHTALFNAGMILEDFDATLIMDVADLNRAPAPNDKIEIVRVPPNAPEDLKSAYLDTYLTGWGGGFGDTPRETTRALLERSGWQCFLAYLDEEPVGQAVLDVAGKIGHFADACTLPSARGKGVQRALFHARARAAMEAGCTSLMSQAEPFGPSMRNMQRFGFELLHMEAVFVREGAP